MYERIEVYYLFSLTSLYKENIYIKKTQLMSIYLGSHIDNDIYNTIIFIEFEMNRSLGEHS